MRDITISNDGSQEENQKTTPVMESLFELASSSNISLGVIFSTWLGMRDSNPRMLGPEPSALPLGESPVCTQKYTTYLLFSQETRLRVCQPTVYALAARLAGCFFSFASETSSRRTGNSRTVSAADQSSSAENNTNQRPLIVSSVAPKRPVFTSASVGAKLSQSAISNHKIGTASVAHIETRRHSGRNFIEMRYGSAITSSSGISPASIAATTAPPGKL